jgi:hypothetical protein
MEGEKPKRSTVFISYSHQDGEWLARLRIHLRPLEREDKVEIWDDTKIAPGTKWNEEIKKALSHTKVAVLLVSADFLASDFIAADELPPLLLAAEEDGARILPLILSPSRFRKTKSLAQFQAVNDPEKPLISLSRADQETVLVKLSEDIERYLKDMPSERAAESYSPQPRQPEGSPNASEASLMPKTLDRKHDGRRRFPRFPTAVWAAIISGMFALLAAIITGIFGLTGNYLKFSPERTELPNSITYTARVVDAETKAPLPGAKVIVGTQASPPELHTDPQGNFSLEFPGSTTAAHLTIEEDDHEKTDHNVTLPKPGIEIIPLSPLKKYTYRVVHNKRPIEGAAVSVNVNGVEQKFTTKSDGLFHFKFPGAIKEVQVQIVATGHEPFDDTVSLSKTGTKDIRIELLRPDKPRPPDRTQSDGLTPAGRKALERLTTPPKLTPSPSRRNPEETNNVG